MVTPFCYQTGRYILKCHFPVCLYNDGYFMHKLVFSLYISGRTNLTLTSTMASSWLLTNKVTWTLFPVKQWHFWNVKDVLWLSSFKLWVTKDTSQTFLIWIQVLVLILSHNVVSPKDEADRNGIFRWNLNIWEESLDSKFPKRNSLVCEAT